MNKQFHNQCVFIPFMATKLEFKSNNLYALLGKCGNKQQNCEIIRLIHLNKYNIGNWLNTQLCNLKATV